MTYCTVGVGFLECLNTEKMQLVAPKSMRDRIFSELHCARTAGHLGVKCTLQMI